MEGANSNHHRNEKIECQIFANHNLLSQFVAGEIRSLIEWKQSRGEICVLGLATGSTPTGVYRELVRLNREGLSFRNVVTFNLDEYFPMAPESLQSYHRFMREHLFDHIDIPDSNINIPDGACSPDQISQHCVEYENKIQELGGLDLQILGIGRTGHIGFNEPGSDELCRTRLITLDQVTRIDAASDFFGAENVPRCAITMGVGTILDSKRIIILALGENKASIVARTVEGEITQNIPATFLQDHQNVVCCLDESAADELTRRKSPWLCGSMVWEPKIIRRAVCWLSQKSNKPILKLTDADYNESGLQDLLAEFGSAYEINLEVFRWLQATITGWPAGKPKDKKRPGDVNRPRDDVYPKRILVFSPHPDDDVISMGGTLIRLAEQGHEVHVAYQTSGNIAVFDNDAIRFAEFVADFCREFDAITTKIVELETHVEKFLKNKQAGNPDSDIVRRIKGLIRQGEAREGARCCGVPASRISHLNLPFYETGLVKKKPLAPEDIAIISETIKKIAPHQIYCAGDLSDPHGTHRTCLKGVLDSILEIQSDGLLSDLELWLYRGAWQEWPVYKIEMAVPLSPQEVERKRMAIFKHESQKDRALFPGPDMREFWQRAEARNADTAKKYDALGLAEYEAIEGFVRWDGQSI